jgi:hypothetical protein
VTLNKIFAQTAKLISAENISGITSSRKKEARRKPLASPRCMGHQRAKESSVAKSDFMIGEKIGQLLGDVPIAITYGRG